MNGIRTGALVGFWSLALTVLVAPLACGQEARNEMDDEGASAKGGLASPSAGADGAAAGAGAAPAGAGGAPAGAGATSVEGGGATSAEATPLYTFAADTEGFGFSGVASPPPYLNLAGTTEGVANGAIDMSWSDKDASGNAQSGSLMISATFTGWNQHFMLEVAGPLVDSRPLNLEGRILRAKVFVESEFSPSPAPGGVFLYIKTGSTWAWGSSGWNNLVPLGKWIDLRFDTSRPDIDASPEYDASEPVQLGLEFVSALGANVGPYPDGPVDAILYIDDITFE